ncbi:hypothetical protein [Oceanibacterium hippocampi]|uniref:Uncharacterized protein n=1 Tax=Oceanibacterium hippocampi TaxID=745714 RepID=A0A1Y5S8V3_9PROT|nr:hypothetical protein [Oceanibacterium hippocampi]SLN34031.1 hypothetical protein OCH7691_01320 [Oceanibacterium hippocampi]
MFRKVTIAALLAFALVVIAPQQPRAGGDGGGGGGLDTMGGVAPVVVLQLYQLDELFADMPGRADQVVATAYWMSLTRSLLTGSNPYAITPYDILLATGLVDPLAYQVTRFRAVLMLTMHYWMRGIPVDPALMAEFQTVAEFIAAEPTAQVLALMTVIVLSVHLSQQRAFIAYFQRYLEAVRGNA